LRQAARFGELDLQRELGKEQKFSKEFINRVQFNVPFYPQVLSFEKKNKID